MIIDDVTPSPLPGDGAWCLDRFRTRFYSCLTRRADALFELADAVACAPSAVTDLARLSLEAEHRRGHGALYDAVNSGVVDTGRLRCLTCAGPMPKIIGPDGRGRIVLAVDVSNWLRPDAATSSERSFCRTYARGSGQAQMIPGWQYSFVCALESGASSWTALLDAVRIRPGDDATAITAAQLRAGFDALTRAGHYRDGDPEVLVVMDAGYDVVRLAWLLADLPVILVGRLRSDRVFHAPAGKRQGPTKGRPPRHGAKLILSEAATHPEPTTVTVNDTARYGRAEARAFERMHPRIDSRGGWKGHEGQLPVIEGTVISLTVEHLPGNRDPKPVWLWVSKPVPDSGTEVDHWWSMFIRRFDLEHTSRFLKQTLGWTWLIIAAHTQLRLARPLAADHRLPWQKSLAPTMLTPARVRAGYRRICRTAVHPAREPKPVRPGPGRPEGRKNHVKAAIQPVRKGN